MFIKRYFEKSEKPQIVRLGLQHRTNGRLLYRLYKKFKTQEGKSIIPKKSGQNTWKDISQKRNPFGSKIMFQTLLMIMEIQKKQQRDDIIGKN